MIRRPAQAGFTLIELLVSLALLGLMMALIGQALPLAMHAAVRTGALSEELAAIQTAQHLLRRQIGEMPASVTQDGYSQRLIFSGSPDAMRFAAYAVAAQGGGGPQLVDLSVAQTASDAALIYVAGEEKRSLVTGAQQIRFAYFGPLARGSTPAWHESWKDTARLPALVRIQVQPKAGALPWPDLVIAVLAGPPPP